jgi:hypothetical protein
MTFERTGGVPVGEPAPQPGTAGTVGETKDANSSAEAISPALRLQILATEHWSLLATRSLAWNESFTRAGMLLSALAGAIVALALVGQGSQFGEPFLLFGIVILPVVLFLGEATYLRLGESNQLDAMSIIGMNRIRHAYLELAPDLEPYFVSGTHDDIRGVGITMGVRPNDSPVVHLLSATPVVVMVINAVVAGAIAALLLALAGLTGAVATIGGAATFLAVVALHATHGRRQVATAQSSIVVRFPGQPADPTW